jgi:rhamnosyltransferase subunit B
MNVIIAAFGVTGDVHPMLGLGRAIAGRGHRVTFVSNARFETLARGVGLEFAGWEPPRPHLPERSPLLHRVSWAARAFARWNLRRRVITGPMRWLYEFIEREVQAGETIVVAHSNSFGARIAREKLGVPLATAHLQPALFRSDYDAPGLPVPDGSGPISRAVRSLAWRAIDLQVDRVVTPPVNHFRAELGLPPISRPFNKWVHSPDLVIGLFPAWYGQPQPDWPSNVHYAGFPLFDESGQRDAIQEVDAFLGEGPPPLIFTAGTLSRMSRRFFETSVEVCRYTGQRGLLLAGGERLIPNDLPTNVRHFAYVPLSKLLDRSAAIVHHGGIGTTALALAAGVPQLVVPFADDQPDNAARVQRLGAGLMMSRVGYRLKAVSRALNYLLTSPDVAAACRSAAARVRSQPPLDQVCRLIEQAGLSDPSCRPAPGRTNLPQHRAAPGGN